RHPDRRPPPHAPRGRDRGSAPLGADPPPGPAALGGRGARVPPPRLHALGLARPHPSLGPALELSRRAPRGSRPRRLHRDPLPSRRDARVRALEAGPGPPHRRLAARAGTVAVRPLPLRALPSFEPAPAPVTGACSRVRACDAAAARHPSLGRPRGDGLELVEPAQRVGPPARHPAAGRAARRDHDRPARPARPARPGLSALDDDAVRGAAMPLVLTSAAFTHQGSIPQQYTCQGRDVSPPLSWSGAPEGTKGFVLILDDPDAPDPAAPKRTWVHWVLYAIPAGTASLPEAVAPAKLPAGTR